MDLDLKERVAIVGGASKGLGRACAEVLAEEGVKLAVCSRTTAETAVGRLGEPRELAYLTAFLASGKASYITGTTILVDGGLVRSVL